MFELQQSASFQPTIYQILEDNMKKCKCRQFNDGRFCEMCIEESEVNAVQDQPNGSDTNTMSDWFDVIREMGKNMRKEHERIRAKLMERSHATFHDPYLDAEKWLWKGEGCIVEATVHNGIIDVYSIQHHSLEYIKALNEVAGWF